MLDETLSKATIKKKADLLKIKGNLASELDTLKQKLAVLPDPKEIEKAEKTSDVSC